MENLRLVILGRQGSGKGLSDPVVPLKAGAQGHYAHSPGGGRPGKPPPVGGSRENLFRACREQRKRRSRLDRRHARDSGVMEFRASLSCCSKVVAKLVR